MHNERFRIIEEEILEALYDLTQRYGRNNRVKAGEILNKIEELNKTQLTNIIRRKFEKEELVDYVQYQGVYLTEKGYKIAEKIARNHRIAEAVLYQKFDVDFANVHRLACILEHSITDELAEVFIAKLDPPYTPCGKKIPGVNGSTDAYYEDAIPFNEAPENVDLEFRYIDHHDSCFYETLGKCGVEGMGSLLKKETKEEEYFIIVDNKKTQVSDRIAQHLFVKIL